MIQPLSMIGLAGSQTMQERSRVKAKEERGTMFLAVLMPSPTYWLKRSPDTCPDSIKRELRGSVSHISPINSAEWCRREAQLLSSQTPGPSITDAKSPICHNVPGS